VFSTVAVVWSGFSGESFWLLPSVAAIFRCPSTASRSGVRCRIPNLVGSRSSDLHVLVADQEAPRLDAWSSCAWPCQRMCAYWDAGPSIDRFHKWSTKQAPEF
jgi:hypothetical protein